MLPDDAARAYRTIDQFTLADLEAMLVMLRGGSVIDWHRLNFRDDDELLEFLRVHEFQPERPADVARLESIKDEAIDYLRRNFDFPVPRSVQAANALEVFRMASGRGHKQVCACIILKVMHIIHHLQGRELLVMLPLSDAEVFHLVEEKVYRVVGGMMASGQPIVEFLGGRKNRDSLYTKLLSKAETIAAQIYDKLRFRIVTRTPDDLFPVVNFLARRLFPFNYAIPGESTNTLVDFRRYCERVPNLNSMLGMAQGSPIEDPAPVALVDNKFSAKNYRVIHFVVDLPVRVPEEALRRAPAVARSLGPVIFVLTEFQIVDQQTDGLNEQGEASHARYKERQRRAVMERLRMGFRTAADGSRADATGPVPALPAAEAAPIAAAAPEPPPPAAPSPPPPAASMRPVAISKPPRPRDKRTKG